MENNEQAQDERQGLDEDIANYMFGLFDTLHTIEREEAEATSEIRRRLRVLELELAQIQKPFVEKKADVTEAIQAEVMAAQKTFKAPYGQAVYTRTWDRISWDDNGLLWLARQYPEILKCRKITTVEPRVTIKLSHDSALKH